jgi:hypothetical protein
MGPALATTCWLFVAFDPDVKIARASFHPGWCIPFMTTAGEVISVGPSRLTNCVDKRMLPLNHACF